MYYLLKVIAFVFSKISERRLEHLAELLTVFGFDILSIRRSTIIENLETAFAETMSPARRQAIARASFKHFTLTVIEFLRGYYVDLVFNVDIPPEDAKHLLSVLNQGKGGFILCSHMGNWEAMGAAVSRLLCPAHVVVKKVGSSGVNRFVNEVRRKNGFLAIQRDSVKNPYRVIKEALSRGELVGFVMDQARPGEKRIPFFGKPAKTNSGLAVLSLRTKISVIPGYSVRHRFGYHSVRFLEPLVLDEYFMIEDREECLDQLTQKFNSAVEEMICKDPVQYFWLHRRWK